MTRFSDSAARELSASRRATIPDATPAASASWAAFVVRLAAVAGAGERRFRAEDDDAPERDAPPDRDAAVERPRDAVAFFAAGFLAAAFFPPALFALEERFVPLADELRRREDPDDDDDFLG